MTGWTEALRAICAGRCGDMGEPACWRLPSLLRSCQVEEIDMDIRPCADCLEDWDQQGRLEP